MSLAVTVDASGFRRAVGVTAWCVLEELALTAEVEDDGALVARTNVRAVATHLGVSKDTAARAIARLVRAGVVRRVVGERGPRGALPCSSYVVDLATVAGLSIGTNPSVADAHETTTASTSPAARRRSPHPVPRVDDAQTSLFDLSANVS